MNKIEPRLDLNTELVLSGNHHLNQCLSFALECILINKCTRYHHSSNATCPSSLVTNIITTRVDFNEECSG